LSLHTGEHNIVHYWAPDSLEWESLEVNYASFFNWLMSTNLNEFYEGLRWSNWEKDVMEYTTNQCFTFYPPLWTEQGNCEASHRGVVPVEEALLFKQDVVDKLHKNR